MITQDLLRTSHGGNALLANWFGNFSDSSLVFPVISFLPVCSADQRAVIAHANFEFDSRFTGYECTSNCKFSRLNLEYLI
jgi:hypothetical protein